ncbi:MAG: TlpA disulfide reductase family protein [Planctomycetota bacterium]
MLILVTLPLSLVLPTALPSTASALAPRPFVAIAQESWGTLSEEYAAALRNYTDRKSRSPSADEKTLGPHPARSYFTRARAIAERGDAGALIWVIENLAAALPDRAQATREGLWAFEQLFAQKATDAVMLAALSRVQRQVDALGESTSLALAQFVEEKSASMEVQAQALWLAAWVRTERGQTKDVARKAEAAELFRTILVQYPHTSASQTAAQALLSDVNEQFLVAEAEWLSAVEAAQAAGKPHTEWPEQPIEDFHAHFKALADAGNDVAKRWIDYVYSAHLRLARTPDWSLGMQEIAESFGSVYPKAAKPAMEVLVRFHGVLYHEFPSATWVIPSLYELNAKAEHMPGERTEAVLDGLVQRSENPEIRALALWVRGEIASTRGDVANDERALALFTRAYTEFPSTAAAEPARKAHDRLKQVVPGSPAQVTVENDLSGREMKLADFRGQVVLLDFFLIKDENCLALAPRRGDLAKKLAGRPFVVVGGAIGTNAPRRIQEHMAKFGTEFRAFLLQSSTHSIVKNWKVRGFPTTFLIDANGIIRARDLEWDEMVSLAEFYVAEAEQKVK